MGLRLRCAAHLVEGFLEEQVCWDEAQFTGEKHRPSAQFSACCALDKNGFGLRFLKTKKA